MGGESSRSGCSRSPSIERTNSMHSHGHDPGRRPFVPALGHRFLTPFYDPLLRLHLRERQWRGRLVDQMRIEAGLQILDVGCGTGTLALLVNERWPTVEVVGIDPDPQILEIARRKAGRTTTAVRFDLGYADRLPYRDSSFDRVVSSLVFHHLSHETKVLALREAWRVLRPGGELHIADVGRPTSTFMRIAVSPFRLFDGVGATEDNLAGRLPTLIADAGFSEVVETGRVLLGVVCLYRAVRPRVT